MAYSTPRTWVAGEYPTAAQFNANIRDNLNAAFPLGGVDGAWTSYTPTLTQSGAVAKTVTYARYTKIGRLIVVQAKLDVTGTGTGATSILFGLPVTAATVSNTALGAGGVYDTSAVVWYMGTIIAASTTTAGIILGTGAASSNNFLGAAGMTAALASGDIVTFSAMYESAS